MKNTTPLFPGFHLQTLRKTPRSARQKLLDEHVFNCEARHRGDHQQNTIAIIHDSLSKEVGIRRRYETRALDRMRSRICSVVQVESLAGLSPRLVFYKYGAGSTLSVPRRISKWTKAGSPGATLAIVCPRLTFWPFFTVTFETFEYTV